MNIPFVDLVAQHHKIRPEIDGAIRQILDSAHFILGRQVEDFEGAFACFIGTKHAIGVGNGLDALRLSLLALGLGPGDEVIIPVNTYIATALAVSQTGATVRFVDCDPATWEMGVSQIAAQINTRTRAIIPVHLYGMAADLAPAMALAAKYGLAVIEDAAQAHGTQYRGKPCGSLGLAGCFSFFPAKNLGCCGDGGLIATNDAEFAEKVRLLRNYGQRVKYAHEVKGCNSRLDAIQAAILAIKLPHLEEWNRQRQRHAQYYLQHLDGVGDLNFQTKAPWSTHIYHLFVLETERRDALQAHLTAKGIATGIHYPTPIHLQKAYAGCGCQPGQFPVAERLARRILSLPMYPELADSQKEYVVAAIKDFFDGKG